LRYASLTEKGRVRDNNEDSCFSDGRVFVVADGMGGHRAGEVASSTAIEVFLRFEKDNRGLDPLDRIREGILSANLELYKQARSDPKLEGMGTTFTCALLEEEVCLGHVGDSRAYRWRGGELDLLTRDHSLVERMVREGHISRPEARNHPQRNIILRALGVSDELEVDLDSYAALPGDRLLLCSDGLTGSLEDEEINHIVTEVNETEACCRRLVDAANDQGGFDNITVVLIDFEGRGARETSRAKGEKKKRRWWRGRS
jgi:protein phosphatase